MKQPTKPKKHSALWRRLALVVLGLLLGVNAYLANARGLGGNQLPMPFGTGFAVVLSGSMEPTLHVNDLLVVRRADQYNVGDIVVYQSGYELIVHRVIAADGDTLVTRGDANNAADPPIDVSAVKGVVAARVPVLGTVVSVLKTPTGILVLLVCAFGLIELSYRRQKDADDRDLEAIKAEIRRLKADAAAAEQAAAPAGESAAQATPAGEQAPAAEQATPAGPSAAGEQAPAAEQAAPAGQDAPAGENTAAEAPTEPSAAPAGEQTATAAEPPAPPPGA